MKNKVIFCVINRIPQRKSSRNGISYVTASLYRPSQNQIRFFRNRGVLARRMHIIAQCTCQERRDEVTACKWILQTRSVVLGRRRDAQSSRRFRVARQNTNFQKDPQVRVADVRLCVRRILSSSERIRKGDGVGA